MIGGTRVMGMALVLSCIVSCESKSDPPAPSLASVEQFVAEVAEISCRSRAACCAAAGVEFDDAECRRSIKEELIEELREDGGEYDPGLAAECLAALEPLCGVFDDSGRRLTACELVYHGDVAPGESCEKDNDCAVASGQVANCQLEGDTELGQCVIYDRVAARHGKLDEACERDCEGECWVAINPSPPVEVNAGAGVACFKEDGLRCLDTCQPLAQEAEVCSRDGDCGEGLYCDLGEALCAPLLEDGADCSANPGACQNACNEETFVCGPAVFDELTCQDYL